MRRLPFLKTLAFVGAVSAIGIFTSCDASWENLETLGRLFGIELKQAGGCGCGCLGQKGTLRVTNDLNVDIVAVFIASAEDAGWGENHLAETLVSGIFYETDVTEGVWSVAVVDTDDNLYYHLNLDIAGGAFINLNISEMALYIDVEAIFGPEPDGPPTTVPDVVGMDQETAKNAIESVGFYMGSVTKAYSGAVPEGNVLSQAPAAGSVIPGGSMISITVAVAEDFSVPEVEADLLAEDVDWEDFPDVDAEKEAIAETLDSFTDALKAGDADAAALKIHSSKQAAYKELFNSDPDAMESFGDLLAGVTISFLSGDTDYIGKQADGISPRRTAEYKVSLDGSTFYVVFMKVDDSWVLYDF